MSSTNFGKPDPNETPKKNERLRKKDSFTYKEMNHLFRRYICFQVGTRCFQVGRNVFFSILATVGGTYAAAMPMKIGNVQLEIHVKSSSVCLKYQTV